MRGSIRRTTGDAGFTAIEMLSVVLLLGVLALLALPKYLGAQNQAQAATRATNVAAVNAAVARFQSKHNGACPDQPGQPTFAAFLSDPRYFPQGAPVDPFTKDNSTLIANYRITTCQTS